MRNRTLGNTVTAMYNKLRECHTTDYSNRAAKYMSAIQPFVASSLTVQVTFERPSKRPLLPKSNWFLTVFVRNVVGRIDDVKARITSTYGRILKMDSTKKVRKSKFSIQLYLLLCLLNLVKYLFDLFLLKLTVWNFFINML